MRRKIMAQKKRKISIKERVVWFLYRIIRAVVGFLVKAKIIKKRKIETVIVE